MSDRWLYQGLAEPFVIETITVDKWFQPASEPVRTAPPVLPGHWAGVLERTLFETPTMDTWYRPASEPARLLPPVPTGGMTYQGEPSLFVVSGVTLDAGPYYWDATLGDDSGVGSIGDPFQTVAVLNTANSIAAGTTTNWKRGESFGEVNAPVFSGSSGSPITMQAYGSGAKPTFTADTDACINLGANSYWTLKNLQPVNGLHPGGNDTVGGGVFISEGATNIVIDGIDITACFGAGILAVGVDTLTIQTCDIAGITNGDDVTRGDAITIRGFADGTPSPNVTIDSNTFGDCDRQQIALIGCTLSTIKKSKHRGSCLTAAITLEPSTDGEIVHEVSSITIEDIDAQMTSGDGIGLGATNGTIDDITIRHSWLQDAAGDQADGRGITMHLATNVVVYGVVCVDFRRSIVNSNSTLTVYNCDLVKFWVRGMDVENDGTNTEENCLFYARADATSDTMIDDSTGNGSYNHNLFWSAKEEGDGLYYDGTWRTTLAAWQGATGEDANSFSADALLSDVDNDEYWPLAGSPTDRRGENLGTDYQEALRHNSVFPDAVVLHDWPTTGPWGIGAYPLLFGAWGMGEADVFVAGAAAADVFVAGAAASDSFVTGAEAADSWP